MSSRNENKSSTEMSIEDLVRMNGEAMAVLDEVPYQPIVYAVPKEWLERWMQLLGNAVQFQPTLYRKLSMLATQEELQKQEVNLKADMEVAKREMLKEIGAWKKQDGSLKEEFFSRLSTKHLEMLGAIRQEYSREKKESIRLMLLGIASSAVLSGLVSGLCLLLNN